MFAMRLHKPGTPLQWEELPDLTPGPGEIRVKVLACGVCRTDLHVVDGDLTHPKLPITPGHEIVGRVDALGIGVSSLAIGQRVGIPWLGHTCGHCPYCDSHHENLCDHPVFTGYTRDGGYATQAVADARFAFPLGEEGSDVEVAPLLCAGLIGWRSLIKTGDAQKVGLYGFGAAAHIIAQVLVWQKKKVFAFTRPGDTKTQDFARELGASWAGGSDELPPEQLDATIIFAPVGSLVPAALKTLRKGGKVVCAGIHMSEIPAFSYDSLWEEREIVSVANLTRQDGLDFLSLAPKIGIHTTTTPYALKDANKALDDLRHGRFDGAAVLVP
ncbi:MULTISPECIES: zinc-dependent alcohol dehydrogenase family protein [Acetobacter]|uniref:alcohol dehydrogenase n=1 Tax=Acetobacter tropicalis NBRC 101654 TaxID=749388 RepID=F7VA12_9PROT|nr:MULTISPECIES: zinc-dependent alcohol dehydrogenase family protein [Acetobacter]MCG4255980.1 zinc-dependent alcohol dehydrogenase family protein [Acetobacter senegalensis]MCG4265887.1 zinc-dependent alcohol dehydrogenase family protein [Acetobacter senegalensis]MDN7355990.1 zinc-dependent alcohol dehydrogenase family protein [Acetobacter senegalensis]MPQ73759.1 zinc-binding alcohol dehydrogenase family protein [Acetobacter senegalensis]GAA07207.1 alcohol dehydrogenase [Acetobacter tropicalis